MPAKKSTPRGRSTTRPKLLAGGNRQIAKGDEIDEALVVRWIKQAAKLPGTDRF